MTAEAQPRFSKERITQFREITKIFPTAELGFLGGEIPVMYAGWGQYLPIEVMITLWCSEATTDTLVNTIKSYGVSGGYFDEDEYDPRSSEAHERSVTHMVAIAESLMSVRGWNHTGLRLTTIFEHPDIAQEVVERLDQKGLHIDEVKFYGLACDGGGGSMIDTIADLETQGKQMLFVAAENLSGRSFPRDNLAMSTLFGNGGGGAAFVPGVEISLVHPELVKAVVEKDTRGVINVPRFYEVNELRQTHPSVPLPPWYKVDPKANFLYSEGVVVNEMTTAGETCAMRRETGVVFKNFVLPLITDLLERYYELCPESEDRIRLALLHQPSKTIITNIANELKKTFGDLCPDISWFMEETGFNNISSANIFVAMTEATRQNLLQPGEIFLLGTFGIGLSAHAAIVQMGK